jgi:methyltransferase family protein
MTRVTLHFVCWLFVCLSFVSADARAQVVVGQDGKDVIYLPTPPELVNKMLDMAGVTPEDYVIDLGSGDGRIVIAAAKRGARALGIEYDGPLVELSRRNAATDGVSDRATFAQADLFESDFSQATVLTMFLLSDIMVKLRPTILAMKPGTRVVANTFGMEEWQPDQTARLEGCRAWCTAHLWIVPAKAEGTWRLPEGDLTLTQTFQDLSGTLLSGGTAVPVLFGQVRGDQIMFTAAGAEYTGRISDGAMQGRVVRGGRTDSWSATRR